MYNVKLPKGHLTSIRFKVELYGSIAVHHASAVKSRLWLHVAEATVRYIMHQAQYHVVIAISHHHMSSWSKLSAQADTCGSGKKARHSPNQ